MRGGRCDEAGILGSVGRRRKAGGLETALQGPRKGPGRGVRRARRVRLRVTLRPLPLLPGSGEGATGHSQTGMSLQQSVRPVCQSLSWVW